MTRQKALRDDLGRTGCNGFVFWQGASMIDGKPVVLIVTNVVKPSKNEKTGPMIQTYILRSDVNPFDALLTGEDVSVCGFCPLRPFLAKLNKLVGKRCYVNVPKAVLGVYRAFKNRRYASKNRVAEHTARLASKNLRKGTYGNPSAIPVAVWQELESLCKKGTGYDHRWKSIHQTWNKHVMASVSNLVDAQKAWTKGYRTFRTRKAHEPLASNEIVCPASAEGGKKRSCITCFACDGNPKGKDPKRVKSIVIIEH